MDFHIYIHQVADDKLDQVLAALADLRTQVSTVISQQEQILMDEKAVLAALAAIDDATSKVAANLTVIGSTTSSIADVGGQIKTEIESLQAQLGSMGSAVPQSISDAVSSLGTKASALSTSAQAATDALSAQVPVLQAIAAEGVSNAVPVAPPPPPPPAA